MTLQRRLLLGISAMFFALLLGVEAIYLANTRAQTEQQLASNAQDAATALALRLGALPDLGDRVLLETLINPVFDRGYYREIRVLSPSGETLAQRVLPPSVDGVPAWFKDLFPLNPPGAQSLVSSGWRETGRVLVLSHPNFAYQQLWRAGTQTAAWLLLMYALAVGAAMAFVSMLLKPLREMEGAAEAIGHRDFRTIADVPRARELARVVNAMNLMSGRIRRIVEHEAARAEELRREAFIDPLTSLYNRRGFQHELRSLLTSRADATSCGLAIIEFQRFGEFNARVGFQRGDEMIKLLSRTLVGACKPYGGMLGRLGGASFAVAVVSVDARERAVLLQRLRHDLGFVLAEQGLESQLAFNIGVATSERSLPPFSALLATADNALERARGKGPGEYEVQQFDAEGDLGSRAWRARIEDALAADRIALYAQNAIALPSRAPAHAEITVRMLREDGEPMPAAQFLPMAARHGLIGRLDLRVAELLLAHLAAGAGGAGLLAMNLSSRTIADAQAREKLLALIGSRRALASRLVIEVTEFGALQDAGRMQHFSEAVRKLGASFALDNFGMRQESLMLVHALKPSYIKLSPGYTGELPASADCRFFVEALVRATQPLDVGIYAQAVEDDSVLPLLQRLGVAGYQGYAAGRPAPLAR